MRILKDYNRQDLENFETFHKTRYDELFSFVSECSTTSIFNKEHNTDDFILSISIPTYPYQQDYACASFALRDGETINLLDIKLF